MKIMLLAAGEGTRFRPHTLQKPKPALPFLNIPLAYYPLSLAEDLGPLDLVVNTFHLPKQIHNIFDPKTHQGQRIVQNFPISSVHFSNEEKLILGSGGGLKNAQKFFEGEDFFLMVNGDEVLFPHQKNILAAALQEHRAKDALSTLIVMEHPEVGTKFGGVWVNGEDRVYGFGKKNPREISEDSDRAYHFTGFQFLSKRIFDYLPEGVSNILHDGLMAGIKNEEVVQVFGCQGPWFETGNEADFLKATSQSLSIYKNSADPAAAYLKSLIARLSPASVFRDTPEALILSASKKIPFVKGFAVVGSNLLADPVKIENSVIDHNCFLKSSVANQLVLESI